MSEENSLNRPVEKRCEIVLFVEVRGGNPNGDPDMGNAPRTDSETGHGFMTDVSVKRVIRDYVADLKQDEEGFRLFVRNGAVLERQQQEGFEATGSVPEEPQDEAGDDDASEPEASPSKGSKSAKKSAKEKPNTTHSEKTEAGAKVRKWLCRQFFDVRAFGGVFAGKKYGVSSVNGPIQVAFARSVDPIDFDEVAITRCAVTSEKAESKERTIGRKHVIHYALYRVEVRVSPHRAGGPKGTGFSCADMKILEEALLEGFEHRNTASKGHMATRAMVVFEHSSALGDAPAFELLDRVSASKKVETPRSFADYAVTVNEKNLPGGVTVRKVR